MAGLNITTSTYKGKWAAMFLAPIVLAGVMLNKVKIMKLLYIKNAMFVPIIKINGVIKAYTSKFEADGDIVVSDKKISPVKFTIPLEFDIDLLEQIWLSQQMENGMGGSDIPPDFETWMTSYIVEQTYGEIDNYIWNGDKSKTGTIGQIDGLLKQFRADDTIIKITGDLITEANIQSVLNSVYLKLPDELGDKPNLYFFMAGTSKKKYKVSLTSKGLVLLPNAEVNGENLYDVNIQVVQVPNFPKDTIVATLGENIVYGTDLESDIQNFNIIDMRQTTGDRLIRFRADFSMDIAYGFGDNIVMYQGAEPVEPVAP